MSKKRILSQDDCAPDSLEYFEKAFKKRFDCTFTQFKAFANVEHIEMGTIWTADVYDYIRKTACCIQVEYMADDPYFSVYEIEISIKAKHENT